MKKASGHLWGQLVVSFLVIALLPLTGAWARPTTPAEAENVVLNWLALEARPLEAALSPRVAKVQGYPGPDGLTAYYVVFLQPRGLVIVPADDLVEPIIGFLPAKKFYQPSSRNPLGALVSHDVPGRVLYAREAELMTLKTGESLQPGNPLAQAQRKWAWLAHPAGSCQPLDSSGLASISNMHVRPFVRSRWDQDTVDGEACYNYYTPPYAAGDPANYPSGCVATAMSQLMRFFRRPLAGVGTRAFTIWIDGSPDTANLRGGDGAGGPYDWADMVLEPSSPSLAQRQAIGALLHDAGLSVHMSYKSGSALADALDAAAAFTEVFGYSNAKTGFNYDDYAQNLPEDARDRMIMPNLHARYPVILGIRGDGGHAIICDGYGHQAGTLYHHLNMGWGGFDDAWYNLPNFETTNYSFTSVYKCIYNVYVKGTGEIIAGRVKSSSSGPLKGATVTATLMKGTTPGLFTRTATTNGKGYYALVKLPSGKKYRLTVSLPGYSFNQRSTKIGTSIDLSTITGNVRNFNFKGTPQ